MKILNTFVVLILFTLSFSSCKKPGTDFLPKDALTGAWEEFPGQNTSRTLIFEPKGKFTVRFKNGSNADWNLMLKGKYTIAGDNLAIAVTEEVSKQASGAIVTTPINHSFFDKGKFDIKNTVLTINYKDYPADGPVDTEVKFNKIIPID